MASGKLSPRQKMINMMYLVLTALLALNVAKEILRSFDLLSDSLRASAEKLREKNNSLGEDIKESVKKEVANNNQKNANLPALVDEANGKTAEVVNFIEAQITAMASEAVGGTDPETGQIREKDNVSKAENYWLIGTGSATDNNGRGAGKAKELKEKLDAYVNWANAWYTKNYGKPYDPGTKGQTGFRQIAVDPKDDPSIPANDDDKDKPWEYYTFHGTPVIANVAMLQKFKNDVRVIQSELLAMLRGKLSEVTFKIDSLVAMDAPISQVVAAGLPFETKLFVTASSKQARPQFAGSGNISVSPDGQTATLKVFASGNVIPKGKTEGTQSYNATIRVPKADGSVQELKINKTFIVRRPEIQITSASVQILYQNCGNDVNIDVPALGDYYNPRIQASNAQVIQAKASRRRFLIVPTGNTTTLLVNSLTNGQTVRIGTVDFRVIPPPKPTIALFIGGQQWNGAAPIPRGATVEVRCIPDANFFRSLPNDARYQMRNVVVLAGTGLTAPQPVGPGQNSRTQGPFAVVDVRVPNSVAPGTKIYIRIDDVNRINFQGRAVEEKFTARELTLSAVAR